MGADVRLFLHRRVVIRVEGKRECHGTLTCKSLHLVNVLENVSILQVPFPKVKVDRRPRSQPEMEVKMEAGREERLGKRK